MNQFDASLYRFSTWQGKIAIQLRCEGYSLQETLAMLGLVRK